MRCNILLVMKARETMENMTSILTSRGHVITEACTSGAQGIRSAQNHPCDIAVVGFSLADMTGLHFAEDLQNYQPASVLLIVPPDQVSYARQASGELDVTCLPKPVTAQSLVTSIEMLLQFRDRYGRMNAETAKLKAGLERRALADKAKAALMKSLGIPEAEAWRKMQKQSMDSGKPLEYVAQHILDIYGKN